MICEEVTYAPSSDVRQKSVIRIYANSQIEMLEKLQALQRQRLEILERKVISE
jgi:type IV secretory pathway protease TraF